MGELEKTGGIASAMRSELKRGDRVLGARGVVLRHIIGCEDRAMFSDAIVARVRGLANDIAAQLAIRLAEAAGEKNPEQWVEHLSEPLAGALIDEPMLLETGLRIDVEGKEPYDRFRGRLMLPIQDARGRVIGFGGRILDGDANPNAPKYLNSPETPLFHKGVMLFNAHRAREPAFKSGEAVVVEGYLDAIGELAKIVQSTKTYL